MKRLIPAVLMLIFIIGVAFFGRITAKSTFSEIDRVLEECGESIFKDEAEKALLSAEKIEKIWLGKRRLICLFANRRLTDELEKSISYLNLYLKDENTRDALYEYQTIKATTNNLVSDQTLSVESFF